MTVVKARAGLRRYPAMVFLAASAVLVTLLPSALLVPLTGPSASAELAPVPGRSDGAGDLEALGQTSTGGLGSGGGLDGAAAEGAGHDGTFGADPGTGANPRAKRCVGKPARQTEDPLSPTCVAFFSGDNGGATAQGVTRDEIRIVLEVCAPGESEETFIDYDDNDDPNARPEMRAYAAHFNTRYQLYGRRVHFYEVRWQCSRSVPAQRAHVRRIAERYQPFAFVPHQPFYAVADEAARLKIVTLIESPLQHFADEHAPYVYSVFPDIDAQVTSLAEFVCRRLAGRPARYSGDPVDQGRRRQFGLHYEVETDPAREGGTKLRDELQRRCGVDARDYTADDAGNPATAGAMRADGVTTVIAVDDHWLPSVAAATIGWHPEWVIIDAGGTGNINSRSFPPDQIRNSLGMSFRRRLALPQQQPAYLAAEDGCAGCGRYADPQLYEELLLLFRGIQAAGPRLTPHNFERGLRALRPHRSIDPFQPAAYLGPGDHYWYKDAMAWWWDPAGTPPGEGPGGCWRLVESGARYRTEDWRLREGDDGFMGSDGSSQPCQGGP